MSEVVKVKISYAQNLARASESGSYGVRGVRKNTPLLARHCINDLHRLRRQLTPHVVTCLLARLLHVAHKDTSVAVRSRTTSAA
jgi:hypothetical protein